MAETASYYMHFSRLDFENYIIDYFTKLIPENLPNVSKEICEQTVRDLRISYLIPRITDDGKVDKRSKFGKKSLDDSHCLSPGAGSAEEGNENEDDFIEKACETYHANEKSLLNFLNVPENIQNSRSEKDLAIQIDKFSVRSMKKFAAAEPFTSAYSVDYKVEDETQKIDYCYQILIGRLWTYARCMRKENDLMTSQGWSKLRSHARILGSFAVYYAALQMYRKKACGDYLPMLNC